MVCEARSRTTTIGYARYVAQCGDWRNAVTERMVVQEPPGLVGIHTNMPATVPANIAKALAFNEAPPAHLTAEGRHAVGPAGLLLQEWAGVRQRDVQPSADAVRDRKLAGRPHVVDVRPRRAQPGDDRARLRRKNGGAGPTSDGVLGPMIL